MCCSSRPGVQTSMLIPIPQKAMLRASVYEAHALAQAHAWAYDIADAGIS